jgi:hypothetical protein
MNFLARSIRLVAAASVRGRDLSSRAADTPREVIVRATLAEDSATQRIN